MIMAIAIENTPLAPDSQGVVRVANTRVTLDTVVAAFLEGCTPEEIAEQYTALKLPDIYLTIGYYLKHQDEVHAYLSKRQIQAETNRHEVEQRFSAMGIRERLLARKSQKA